MERPPIVRPRAYQEEMLSESLRQNIIVAVRYTMLLLLMMLTISFRWTQEVEKHKCVYRIPYICTFYRWNFLSRRFLSVIYQLWFGVVSIWLTSGTLERYFEFAMSLKDVPVIRYESLQLPLIH